MPESSSKKKDGIRMNIPTIVLSAMMVLVLGVALGAFVINPLFFNTDNEPETVVLNSDAVAGINPEQDEFPEPIIANFPYELILGDIVLTQPEYNFYFNDFMFQRHEHYFWQHGMVEPFSVFEPLENQQHWDGTQTWADYFHRLIEDIMRHYAGALESGISLSDADMELLEEYELWLSDLARNEGLTPDEFVSAHYEGLTAEMFLRRIERDLLIGAWINSEIEGMTFTQDELEAFYYENWVQIDPMNNGVRNTDVSHVDARHILVAFPGDEPTEDEIENARQAAEAILAEWQAGDATEESFALLAAERTEDFASVPTGGLYADIFPGQMVPEFDAWVFYENRQPEDTGIIETQFGFHVIYFVRSHIDWERRAETALIDRAFEQILDDLRERFPAERRRV